MVLFSGPQGQQQPSLLQSGKNLGESKRNMLPDITISPCPSKAKIEILDQDSKKVELDVNKIIKLQAIPSKIVDGLRSAD